MSRARTGRRGAGARRRRGVPPALVEWRDGVHVVGTELWCDARRAREACFISSALVPEARRHRQIIATAETLALLAEGPAKTDQRALAVPYGRPFTLGDARLELFPSGNMLGAASLLVEVAGARVVHAGVVNLAGTQLADPAEVRACDALVIDVAHARPRFPAAAEALDALRAWIAATIGDGATPVLLATPLSTGLELCRALSGDLPLRAHRAFVEAVRKARSLGREVPAPRRFAGPPPQGEVVLWPAAQREAAALSSIRRARIASVGPFTPDPHVRAEAVFRLTDRADHPAITRYAEATKAATIYLLHSDDDTVRALTQRGLDARPLGSPRQLGLF